MVAAFSEISSDSVAQEFNAEKLGQQIPQFFSSIYAICGSWAAYSEIII